MVVESFASMRGWSLGCRSWLLPTAGNMCAAVSVAAFCFFKTINFSIARETVRVASRVRRLHAQINRADRCASLIPKKRRAKRNESSSFCLYVIGNGSVLTMTDLRAPGTTRWLLRRKGEVVAFGRGALLWLEDLCSHYLLSRRISLPENVRLIATSGGKPRSYSSLMCI
jgi:Protein of unknown function (DUF1153)